MPVVFAGIVPSSPLLLPGLVQSVVAKVTKTAESLVKVKTLIENAKAEFLVIIGHDGLTPTNSPVLLQSPLFKSDFAEYGDLISAVASPGAVGFVHSLKERLQTKMNIPMRTPNKLPPSVSIPLLSLPPMPIAPIILPPNLPSQLLMDFGAALGDFIASQKGRVAVLASGQLTAASHLSQEMKILGSALLSSISNSDSDSLVQLSSGLKNNLQDTLVDPLLVLYQCLPTPAPKTTVLSYQESHGITHITAKINW